MIPEFFEFEWVARVCFSLLMTYGLAQLISLREGPSIPVLRKTDGRLRLSWSTQGFLFLIRLKAGVYQLGEDGRPKKPLGKLFSCPACLGPYIAIITVVYGVFFPSAVGDVVLLVGAVYGGQAFMHSWANESPF